ncbi:MAG: acyltransferase family protein [Dysgonomonas sp.]|nr:acyltransferase family protein [Dysgonomonas sp.]
MGEDKHLNSIKFVLISLVVYGHVNQYNLLNSDLVFFVFSYFSTFAMPLFIVISGFLSKKLNWKKYKRTALSLFLTYFVFQTIYYSPAIGDALFGLNMNLTLMGGKFNIINYLLMPIGPLWFLLGLIVWRFIVLLISKFKIGPVVSFSVSILIALALGFVETLIPHTKIFVFLPFFLAGYYCPKEFTQKLRTYNKISAVAILLLLLVLLHFFGGKDYLFSTYGDPPYLMYSSTFNGIAYRLLFYPLALICSMAVFILTPDVFHKWGGKSMDIYLLHPLFIYPIYYNILFSFHVTPGIIGEILVTIAIITACLLISKIKITRYFLYPILLLKR